MINLYKELSKEFEEISPKLFYRDIFPKGELDEKNSFTKGGYTGIACEFCGVKKANGKELVKRYSITDDLDVIDELLKSNNFIIISPISYAGKSRSTENARFMYAFAIEIDGLLFKNGKPDGFNDLIHQMNIGFLPKANYIVASGNGLHLYYLLDKPLTLFPNVKKSLKNYKKCITKKFWNRYVTTLYEEEKIQYESAFQGFRLAGGVAKNGERTRIFKVSDERISIESLNKFVTEENRIDIAYKSDLTLNEAKKKYPKWYENRIVNKKPKGSWTCKRDLYDWWLRKLKNDEAHVGHRYYCLMILCIYAIKCNIDREELENDCYSLLDKLDSISTSKDNQFTIKDIADALQSFEDRDLVTYPIETISKRSGIHIEKNKRNYQKQKYHLEEARAIRDIRQKRKGTDWRNGNGRPLGSKDKEPRKNKGFIVKEWRNANPNGTKVECNRATGLDPKTIRKYWDN